VADFAGLQAGEGRYTGEVRDCGVGEGGHYVSVGAEIKYNFTKRSSVSFRCYYPLQGKNILAGGGFV